MLHRLASMQMHQGGKNPGVKGTKAPSNRPSIFSNYPGGDTAVTATASVAGGGAGAGSARGRASSAGVVSGVSRRDVIPEPRPASVDNDPFPVLKYAAQPTQPTYSTPQEVPARADPPTVSRKFTQVSASIDPGSTSSSVLSLSLSTQEDSSRNTRTESGSASASRGGSASASGSAGHGGRVPTISPRRVSGTFSPTGRSISPRLDLSPRSPRAGSIQSPSKRPKTPWNSNPVVPTNDVPTGNQLRRSQDKGVIGE